MFTSPLRAYWVSTSTAVVSRPRAALSFALDRAVAGEETRGASDASRTPDRLRILASCRARRFGSGRGRRHASQLRATDDRRCPGRRELRARAAHRHSRTHLRDRAVLALLRALALARRWRDVQVGAAADAGTGR